MPSETDVLVVGAGPTGLMLSAQLALFGVRYRNIDRIAERSPHSRALVVHARSLEHFQSMGLADELIRAGSRTLQILFHRGHKPPLRAEITDIGAANTPYPFLLFVSQVETERVLESRVRVEYRKELVSYEAFEDRIEAKLADGELISAKYLVGCDGAYSVVRKLAKLSFEGAAYPQDFVLADVRLDDLDHDAAHFFVGPKGVLAAFPMADGRFRLISSGGEDAPEGEPTLEEVSAQFRELTKLDRKLRDPIWISRFRLQHRAVDRYREGRVFVAGDAAHVHSPAGGQGMNTGLQDAFNLAWKLALGVRGRVTSEFLDSYHAERFPVGQFLLRYTDRLFSLGTTENPFVSWLRGAVLPHAAAFVLGNRRARARLLRTVSQLGIRYPDSRITGEGSGVHGGVRPGDRLFDAPHDGSTLFQRLAAPSHHLLVFGEKRAKKNELYEIVPVGSALAKSLGIENGGCYLIRPDGYVGFRAGEDWPSALEEYLARVYVSA